MDSPDSLTTTTTPSPLSKRLMPFLALLETDFRTMLRSWLVRIWIVLLAGQGLFILAVSTDATNNAANTIAGLLSIFPLVWSTVVIIVSGGAVSSESGVVADSILSKAVRRTEYILAKLLSRLGIVLGLFLALTVPVAYIIAQNASGDVDSAGLVWAFAMVGLMLTLLTSLAVASSTLFNNTLVAVVVVWFAWYIAGAVTGLLQADYLSPLGIVDSLPALLEGDYNSDELLRSVLAYGVLAGASVTLTTLHFVRKDV